MSTGYPILVLSLQVMLALPLLRQFGRFLVDPRELCSPLTMVAGGFVGLYVASYYFTSDHDRDAFLTVDGYFTLLLLAVLAEYALWAGFVLGCAAATRRELPFHRPTVCRYGVALIGAGLAARAVFIQKSGGFLAFFGRAPRRRRHLGGHFRLPLRAFDLDVPRHVPSWRHVGA